MRTRGSSRSSANSIARLSTTTNTEAQIAIPTSISRSIDRLRASAQAVLVAVARTAGRLQGVHEEALHGEDLLDEDQVEHDDRRAHADQRRGRRTRERAGMVADHPLVRHALRNRGPHVVGALLLPEQRDDQPQAHRRERRRRHEPGHEQRAEPVPRRRQRRGPDRRGVEEVRQRQCAERRMEQEQRRRARGRRPECSTGSTAAALDDARTPRVRSRRAPQTEREPGPDADRHRSEQHPHVGGVSLQPTCRSPSGSRPTRTRRRSRSGRTPGASHEPGRPSPARRDTYRGAPSAGSQAPRPP